MKKKITERCVTVGDLRQFLRDLELEGIDDDQKLNPDSSKLVARSQREDLDEAISDAVPEAVRNFSRLAQSAKSPAVKASEKIEAALKQGVVLWVETGN